MTGARRWPFRLTAREGYLNARTGGVVAVGLLAATAWVTAVAGVADGFEVQRLIDEERRWVNAGGLTLIAQPASTDDSDAFLDAAQCDRLAFLDGVDASFAVARQGQAFEPSFAPGTSATAFDVTAGALPFFDVDQPAGPSVLVPAATATKTGLVDGQAATFRSTDARGRLVADDIEAFVRVLDSEILRDDVRGAYLMPTLVTEGAIACYVQTDAAYTATLAEYVPGVLGGETSTATVSPRLPASTFGIDFDTAYQERIPQYGWAVAAAVVAAAWAFVQRSRRSRLAVYATFGAAPAARLSIVFTEWLVISGLGVAVGWVLGMVTSLALAIDPHVALVHASSQSVAAWSAASVLVLVLALMPIGTILDSLKDRT